MTMPQDPTMVLVALTVVLLVCLILLAARWHKRKQDKWWDQYRITDTYPWQTAVDPRKMTPQELDLVKPRWPQKPRGP